MACPTVMLQTVLVASLLGVFLLTRMTNGQKLIMRHDTIMAEKGNTVNLSCICDQHSYGFYQTHRIIWRHTGNDVTYDKKLSENGRLEQREQYYSVEFRILLPLGYAAYLVVKDLDESRAGRYSCSLVDEMDKVLDEKIMNLNIGVITTAAKGLENGEKTQRPIKAGSTKRKTIPLITTTEMFFTKKLTDRILVETVASASTNKLYPVYNTTDTSLGIDSPISQVHASGSQGSFGWFMTKFPAFLIIFNLLFG